MQEILNLSELHIPDADSVMAQYNHHQHCKHKEMSLAHFD